MYHFDQISNKYLLDKVSLHFDWIFIACYILLLILVLMKWLSTADIGVDEVAIYC